MHRPIVIAGSREQFCDWCSVHHTNPLAAVYVETVDQFLAATKNGGDVRLWGAFNHNPAYLAYLWQRLKTA